MLKPNLPITEQSFAPESGSRRQPTSATVAAWGDAFLTQEETLIQTPDRQQTSAWPDPDHRLQTAPQASMPPSAAAAGLSLKQVWLEALPQSGSHVVSPSRFKVLLQSTLDFLNTHKLPATVWAKLPRGDVWWSSLQDYARDQPAASIYSLGHYQPDSPLFNWQPLPLSRRCSLKGEYLLAILAPGFSFTMLAVRQPGTQPDAAAKPSAQSGATQLALWSSLGPQALQALQPMLRSLVKAAVKQRPAAETILARWDRAFPVEAAATAASPLTDAFFSWQLQAQNQLSRKLLEQQQAAAGNHAATPQSPALSAAFLQKAGQELINPLTTIKTALTLLNSPRIQPEQRHRYLAMISRECDRQSALVQHTFELLTLQLTPAPTELKPLQLIGIVPGIISSYQPLAHEHNIQFSHNIPANLPAVAGQEDWIKQALIQLLDNSLQFTEKHGQIGVCAYQYSDQLIALTVQDTGLGISEREISRVFDPFFRGSAAIASGFQGAGLGLTLAKKLIELCGGQLKVDDTLKTGTFLTALLPVYGAVSGE